MHQEGRGIGLKNKLLAYALQEKGRDTVEANAELGFKPDLREYGIGAQILADLGLKQLRLMTNNPRKIVGLKAYGLEVVERVPLQVGHHEHNRTYLETKRTASATSSANSNTETTRRSISAPSTANKRLVFSSGAADKVRDGRLEL
jgi:GTP cyclohydrolase II